MEPLIEESPITHSMYKIHKLFLTETIKVVSDTITNISQEARREEMLVNRLMRQSQQERRIAVQLLQARHEKDVIRSNRLIREKQYEDRRLREFEDALNRESVSDASFF